MSNDGGATCCLIVLVIIPVIGWICWYYYEERKIPREIQLEEAAERARKRKFQIWYNSLTTEEKTLYQLERQNKLLEEQGRTGRAIAGMVATHNMFDTLHRH